jgi:hypothetical protein
VPFEGESVAHSDYNTKPLEPRATPAKGQGNADHQPVFHIGEGMPLEGRRGDYPAYAPSEYARQLMATPRPASRGPSVPFEGESVSRSDYNTKPLEPRASPAKGQGNADHQPVFHIGEGMPLEGRRGDYPAYAPSEYARQLAATPRSASRGPSVPFEGESVSRSDYNTKPLEPRASPAKGQGNADHQPVFHIGEGMPLEGRRGDYPAYAPSEYARQLMATPRPASRGPSVPFEGESVSRSDYNTKPLEPRATPAKGQGNADHQPVFHIGEGMPLEGRRGDYPAYAPSEYAKQLAATPRSASRGPSVPFEGESVSRSDYNTKPLEPRASPAKGQGNADHQPVFHIGEGMPLEGRRGDYPAYAPSEYARHLPATPRSASRGPSVPFEGESVSHAAFKAPGSQPRASSAPRSRSSSGAVLPAGAHFDGQTSSRAAYQPPTPERVHAAGARSSPAVAAAPHVRFEGESSSRAAFKPPVSPAAARTTPARPQSAIIFGVQDSPDRFVSASRAAFTPPRDRCPSNYLPSREASPSGHVLYRRQSVDRAVGEAARASTPGRTPGSSAAAAAAAGGSVMPITPVRLF